MPSWQPLHQKVPSFFGKDKAINLSWKETSKPTPTPASTQATAAGTGYVTFSKVLSLLDKFPILSSENQKWNVSAYSTLQFLFRNFYGFLVMEYSSSLSCCESYDT